MKYLIIFLFPTIVFSQELHHEMISSQGKNVELESGIYVTQSIGQQSITGNVNNSSNKIIQGYQQVYWKNLIASTSPVSINITFYPNPVTDIINFNFSNLETSKVNVMIFDYSGRNLANSEIDIAAFKSVLDVSMLPSGSYLIYLHNNKINFYTKIIKKWKK